MKPITRIFAIAAMPATLVGPAVTAAAQSGVSYYHCHVANYYSKGGKNGGSRVVFYHSALFPAAKAMDLSTRSEIEASLLRYVEGKYPAADRVYEKRCVEKGDKAHAEKLYRYQTTKSLYEHVMTGWRPGGR